jgi:hypothetical protein
MVVVKANIAKPASSKTIWNKTAEAVSHLPSDE